MISFQRLMLWGVLILALVIGVGHSLGQEATVVFPTFTPSPTPSATPTLAATIDALGNTVTAYFTASEEEPLTGQPFRVTLTVELPPGVTLTEAPTFSDPWEDFMVRVVGEPLTQTTNDKTVYSQVMTVILWRPGYYRTPETFIGYSFGAVEETLRIPVRPAFITVPSVLNTQDYNLRPFKPLVYLPYLSPLVVIGALVVVIGAARVGIYWYKRRPSKPIEVVPPSPLEVVTEALEQLKDSELPSTEIVTQTSDHLRRYLQARFNVPAPDLTTEELIERLRSESPLSDKLLNELQRLLSEADVIKFANSQPEPEFVRRFIDVTGRWVTVAEKSATQKGPV